MHVDRGGRHACDWHRPRRVLQAPAIALTGFGTLRRATLRHDRETTHDLTVIVAKTDGEVCTLQAISCRWGRP